MGSTNTFFVVSELWNISLLTLDTLHLSFVFPTPFAGANMPGIYGIHPATLFGPGKKCICPLACALRIIVS